MSKNKKRPDMCGINNPMNNPEIRKKQKENCKAAMQKPEVKEKIRIYVSSLGDKHPMKNLIYKEKMIKSLTGKMLGEKHPMYGKHHSEESKSKIRIANIGRKQSKETIEKRICCGDKHWNWQGGESFKPYCKDFNNILKRKIRNRDDYICQMPNCLCTQLESLILYKKSLIIHHIDYNKDNCFEENLITLCSSCNSKVNFNRDYWEKVFTEILKKRNLIK